MASTSLHGQLPLIVAAGIGLLVVRVPGGKLDLVFVEAVDAQDFEGEVDAADDFVFDLFGSAEDVGVVLGKAAHTQLAVHHRCAITSSYDQITSKNSTWQGSVQPSRADELRPPG
jgi:hypothetical protein